MWFFYLPGRRGKDHKTGKTIHYPLVVFEEKQQKEGILNAIREKAPDFIEKHLTNLGNIKISMHEKTEGCSAAAEFKQKNNAALQKKTDISAKAKQATSFVTCKNQ